MSRAPAEATPGSARSSDSSVRYAAIARGKSGRPDTGTAVRKTTRRSPWKPMSTLASAIRLRPSRPAPITSATASAISVTTKALRAQPPLTPRAEPLPPCRRPSARSTRDTCHAGASPKITLASSEAASANASADRSTVTSSSRGRSAGASASSAVTPHRAIRMPPAPASSASTMLSVSICRTSRIRPAPTAARTTSSRPRADARASSRFATFAHAINNTNPTAASSTNNVCLVSPTIISCSGTTATPLSPLLTGYSFDSRAAMPVISDCACDSVTPAASRPTAR